MTPPGLAARNAGRMTDARRARSVRLSPMRASLSHARTAWSRKERGGASPSGVRMRAPEMGSDITMSAGTLITFIIAITFFDLGGGEHRGGARAAAVLERAALDVEDAAARGVRGGGRRAVDEEGDLGATAVAARAAQ